MSQRKEAIKKHELAKKRQFTVFGIVALVLVVLVLIASFFVSHSKRTVTDIEKAIPSTAQAVFVSKANAESWKYFNALANTNFTYVPSAKLIGYAMNENHPVLYILGDTKEIENSLKTQNIDFVTQDDVIALTKDTKALSVKGIGQQDPYIELATNGSDTSFGYVNFKALSIGDNKELSFNIPKIGTWSGSFKNGKWAGSIDNVDYSAINQKSATEKAIANPTYRSFLDSYDYNESQGLVKGSLMIQSYNSLRDPAYDTAMNWFSYEIKGNDMSFTMTQLEEKL